MTDSDDSHDPFVCFPQQHHVHHDRNARTESPQGITVYQLTKSGLMAKGSVQGTEYWKDDALN